MGNRSEQFFREAEEVLVGGVNSPVRAYKGVGGTPPFIARAEGAYIWDEDGNRYIDYVGSWGPAILGHSHPKVVAALNEALKNGTSFGAPCRAETTLAGMVRDLVPSIEKLRLVNSGTEATMSAIRLARGATGRDKIIKFDGCYHGHADSLLVKAGSGALTFGEPDSAGVPASFAAHTLVADYNALDQVEKLFAEHVDAVAAVIVEPVAGNMGCLLPVEGFLPGLRSLCDKYGAILIFDEVMTGFRVARGGAQEHFKIQPDLTCLGKVIGGGLPVGAYGGKKELMEQVAPLGSVYQAGTLSGNPLAMAAGIATLKELIVPGVYERLSELAASLVDGIAHVCKSADIALYTNAIGGMWGVFFGAGPVNNLNAVQQCDIELFKRYFHAMLEAGIYLAPSAYEAGFVSLAHTDEDIEATISVAKRSLNLPAKA